MSKTYADIADRLRQNKDRIFDTWVKCVRQEIPAAKRQDKTALTNTLPELFDRIVQTLAKTSPKHTAELERELEIAREHGSTRSKLKNYGLDQVIHEYQLFRIVILNILEEDGQLEREDRDVVLDAISLSERKAASEFTRVRSELEKGVRDLQEEGTLREMFISALSHDLRTPIAAARMNIELLIRKKDTPGALELHTGRALDSLTRVDAMIQDLLDANKIKAGESIPLKIDQVELNDLLRQTLDSLTAIHGYRFLLESQQSVLGYWDSSALKRSVENLCTNAVKYGTPGRPITVSVKAPPEQLVEITVHNWGPPIPKHEQTTIFQHFKRGSSAAVNGKKGWGIGLVLVQGIADAHGGNVHLESSQESGTTFTLRLPLDARPRQAQAA